MHMVTEIENAREREAAGDYLGETEAGARRLASVFDAGSVVHLGGVRRLRGGATFKIAGKVDGTPLATDITIPARMPESDIWCLYYDALESAGLTVAPDASYEAFIRTLTEPCEAVG